MHLHISKTDHAPKYLQIVNQVKALVAAGRLAPGEELPTIRALAHQLVLNPNTVARAYRQLEEDGIVSTRGAAGTCVANNGSPPARAGCVQLLSDRIDALLTEAHQLGFSTQEVLDLLRERDRQWHPQPMEK